LMGLLAVFFVFDFAINFLSALLRAVEEQSYLVKVTAAAAAGFGLLLVVLPGRPGAAGLMAAFIAAQAAWVLLLLIRVAGRWPTLAAGPRPPIVGEEGGGRKPAKGLVTRDQWGPAIDAGFQAGQLSRTPARPRTIATCPLQPNAALLPPALRALALGLLVETALPLPTRSPGGGTFLPRPGGGGAVGKADLWRTLRCKCGELLALVQRADDPGAAAAYVLDYLPKHFEHVLERAAAASEGGGPRSPVRTTCPLTSGS
jgi:hypothetical protein